MTTRHRFRLLNVFVDEDDLSGNALCVFEDGTGLSDERMQALALQFNLSETTFVFPSTTATARVRIFTPSFEMPFAGHPTLGTAHAVQAMRAAAASSSSPRAALTLEMKAGIIAVESADGATWTLQANPPRARAVEATRTELAAMLGIEERDLAEGVSWVDTGSEQLVIPLASTAAVARCRPEVRLLAKHGSNGVREGLAYVWAREEADATKILARFFFAKHGVLVEDPGTGSACANLGGWLLSTGAPLPARLSIRQGEQTGRPCRLELHVDADRRIFVTGRVVAIGGGEIVL
ncbi:MAG: phenazine biosynthesis protein PhzC/PhzF [Myxococcaceae bacterium]|nr:phenazine biosynthesis protein PhzC/PhzF [Myxococcaceae bacterium]